MNCTNCISLFVKAYCLFTIVEVLWDFRFEIWIQASASVCKTSGVWINLQSKHWVVRNHRMQPCLVSKWRMESNHVNASWSGSWNVVIINEVVSVTIKSDADCEDECAWRPNWRLSLAVFCVLDLRALNAAFAYDSKR
jgi:hypothetical protein